jgi:hypothetical protein
MLKTTALAVLAASALCATGASAAIRCQGSYQIIQGNLHVSPWCEDNRLAEIARAYGMRASASAIRNNPSVKAQACRLVGADNRVRDTCQGFRPDRGRGFAF